MSSEAARRLAKAERFLAQATQLAPADAPEATIHLTYYAMLHAAEAVLAARQGRTPKSHGAIIGQFSKMTKDESEEGRSLSRAFNRAEDARLLSDYADDIIPDGAEATQMLQTAKAFVAFCRSMLETHI